MIAVTWRGRGCCATAVIELRVTSSGHGSGQLWIWARIGECTSVNANLSSHLALSFGSQLHILPLSPLAVMLENSYQVMRYMFDCFMQLLIMKDGEQNHSMGSSIDGTPPQSED